MPDQHPSSFTLMRHLVAELPSGEAQGVTEHVAGCATCQGAAAELRGVQEQGARMAPPPPPILGPRGAAVGLRARRRRWWHLVWMTPLGTVTVAAAVLLWFRTDLHDVRTKGGARVSTACKHEGRTWSCRNGERLRPGTAIMIELELDTDREVLLVGRDGSGVWRTYFGGGGGDGAGSARSRHLLRGRHTLPNSLVLDDSPGPERFFIVDSPIPLVQSDVALGLERGELGRSDDARAARVTELVFPK